MSFNLCKDNLFINDWLDNLPVNMPLAEPSFQENSIPSPTSSSSFPADLLDIDLQMNYLDPFIQQLLDAVDNTPKAELMKMDVLDTKASETMLHFDLASLNSKSPDYLLSPEPEILSDENNSNKPLDDIESFRVFHSQSSESSQNAYSHSVLSPESESLGVLEIKPELLVDEEVLVESSDSNQTLTVGSKTPYSDATQCRKRSRNGHIKRPMNAFMIFAQRERRRLASSSSTMHNAAISKQCGLTWKSLTPSQKRVYEEEAVRLKSLHEMEFPEYKYKPKKKVKTVKQTSEKSKKSKLNDDMESEIHSIKLEPEESKSNYLTVNGVKMHAFNATLVFKNDSSSTRTISPKKYPSASTNPFFNAISINVDENSDDQKLALDKNHTSQTSKNSPFVLLDSRNSKVKLENSAANNLLSQNALNTSKYPTPPPEN